MMKISIRFFVNQFTFTGLIPIPNILITNDWDLRTEIVFKPSFVSVRFNDYHANVNTNTYLKFLRQSVRLEFQHNNDRDKLLEKYK